MSFAEIEAGLPQLTPDELRRLAMKSWTAFVEKEFRHEAGNECSEDDPQLLAALDEAIEKAGVRAVISGDASCLMQIGGRLTRKKSTVRAMHLAELLSAREE